MDDNDKVKVFILVAVTLLVFLALVIGQSRLAYNEKPLVIKCMEQCENSFTSSTGTYTYTSVQRPEMLICTELCIETFGNRTQS